MNGFDVTGGLGPRGPVTPPQPPAKYRPKRQVLEEWSAYHAAVYPGKPLSASWLSRRSGVPYRTAHRFVCHAPAVEV